MIDVNKIDFAKSDGLVPAIIVDAEKNKVLMLGFMNKEALKKTIEESKVVFYSRTKKRLWLKGETSKNYLNVKSISTDCDNDTLLIHAIPEGPTCHTGNYSCFTDVDSNSINFLPKLFELIKTRQKELPKNSYTTELFNSGINRIVQKVGEEAIETVIAAKNNDKDELINETSDLIYHLFVLLANQDITIQDISENLAKRHKRNN